MRQEVRREARPAVRDLDRDPSPVIGPPGRDDHLGPPGSKVQSVVHQVVQSLSNTVGVDLGDYPGGYVDQAGNAGGHCLQASVCRAFSE
jgi:hypothetical protein